VATFLKIGKKGERELAGRKGHGVSLVYQKGEALVSVVRGAKRGKDRFRGRVTHSGYATWNYEE